MIGSETKHMMLRKGKLSGRALEEYQKEREGQEKPKGTEQTRGKRQKERKRERGRQGGREGGREGGTKQHQEGRPFQRKNSHRSKYCFKCFFGGCD